MIQGLKPYPEYRSSGVAWLGTIPRDWRVAPIRRMGVVQGGKALAASALGEQRRYLRVANVFDGRIDARQVHTMPFTESEFTRFRLSVDDVLLNEGQSLELVGRAARYVGVPPDCAFQNSLIRVRAFSSAEPRYLEAVFRYSQASGIFASIATQTTSIAHLGVDRLADLSLAFPPLADQRAVVRFVDHAEGRIRRCIAAKRKLIALLEEQKQAIVHRAVTRGLDPNARLKDAGVQWLGEVPAHWDVSSLKRLAHSRRDGFTDGDWVETPYITETGIRLIQTGNIGIGSYREKGYRYISQRSFDELRCTEVEPRDVLICRLDGPVGRACLAPSLGVRMITSVDNTILKPRNGVNPDYVVMVLSSPSWLDWIQSLCRAGGGFRYRISRSMLGDLKIPLPPTHEQLAIVDAVRAETSGIAHLIEIATRTSDLLREYRSRLISDVVTGKLDVREATAHLLAEAPIDELDDGRPTEVDAFDDPDLPEAEADAVA